MSTVVPGEMARMKQSSFCSRARSTLGQGPIAELRKVHNPASRLVSRRKLQNRAVAMRILKARLAERMRQEQQTKLENLRGERKGIDFGSQIRSYVLAPYRLVKDHRTNVEIGDVDRVLDGDLEELVEAELRRRAESAGTA